MDGPSWNIGFPKTPSLYQEPDDSADNNICGRNGYVTPVNGKNSFPQTPPSMLKSNKSPCEKTPGSNFLSDSDHIGNRQVVAFTNSSSKSGGIPDSAGSETKVVSKACYPKVFLPRRTSVVFDVNELQCSVDAKIAKNGETYICMHDVAEYVSKKVAAQRLGIKWRHYNDAHFLFNLQDKQTRDRFVDFNRTVPIGDGLVKFLPWKKAVSEVVKPCHIKVWLRLTGLPIENFDFSSVEFVVSHFGRLSKCNLKRKNFYIGCFYVMIDCPNIDAITPFVCVQNGDDGEFPVTVEKLYACPLDVYNMQKFSDNTPYDEIISTLVERGKLIPLLGN